MPGAVRLKLDQAIADHLRTHGARHYDLLRDNPAFAPWLGSHLGARGEKRLDRAIRDLRCAKAKRLGRGAIAAAGAGAVAQEGAARDPADTLADDPAQRVASAGAAVVSYDELQAELRLHRSQIQRAIAECLDEDGVLQHPLLFMKLSRELRALVSDSANLTKRYHGDLNSEAAVKQLLDAIIASHVEQPQKALKLIEQINTIIHGTGGIAATGQGQ